MVVFQHFRSGWRWVLASYLASFGHEKPAFSDRFQLRVAACLDDRMIEAPYGSQRIFGSNSALCNSASR